MDPGIVVGGLVQPRFDVAAADGAPSFAIDRARLDVSGKQQAEGAPAIGERVIVEFMPTPKLLDAWLQVGGAPFSVRVGQMKIPISRANATPDSKLLMPWGAIITNFVGKREIGATVVAAPLGDKLDVQVGAYDGEGINIAANGNGDLLLAGRVAWTPTGGPPPNEFLHDPGTGEHPHPRVFSVGVSAHRNVTGVPGARTGAVGIDGELFAHVGRLTAEVEVMSRKIRVETDPSLSFGQHGVYGQFGVWLPGQWAGEHLALLGRVEEGDPYVSALAPVVDETHPAPDPDRLREELAVAYYVDAPPFRDPQDARVALGYRASQELEGSPIHDDQVSLAVTLAF